MVCLMKFLGASPGSQGNLRVEFDGHVAHTGALPQAQLRSDI